MGQLTGVLHASTGVTISAQRRFYQPELDGLRFYAFLGVFVCHTLPFEPAFYRPCHGCGARFPSRARQESICSSP